MLRETVRVVIADDHATLRKVVRRLIEKSPNFQVVGEACDGQEAVRLVNELSPDLLILDIQMPVMDGIEVLDELGKKGLKVRVLILSAFDDPYFVTETLSRGAGGYVLKEDAPAYLKDAILSTLRGDGRGLSPRILQRGMAI